MSNAISNVQLSFCRKENWNEFKTIDERNRFCASCQHRVTDFSQASATDLASALKEGGRVCGRFHRSQMSAAFLAGLIATTALAACKEDAIPSLPTTAPMPIEAITQEEEIELMLTGIIVSDSWPLEDKTLPDSIHD
jgi:hypothetical protein